MRSKVVLPAPLCPIKPRHSPRLSSKPMSLTAQNSSGRSTPSGPLRLPRSSLQMSCTPYHMDFLRLRQNFFDSPATLITGSAISIAHALDQDRHRQAEHAPEDEQQADRHRVDHREIDDMLRA